MISKLSCWRSIFHFTLAYFCLILPDKVVQDAMLWDRAVNCSPWWSPTWALGSACLSRGGCARPCRVRDASGGGRRRRPAPPSPSPRRRRRRSSRADRPPPVGSAAACSASAGTRPRSAIRWTSRASRSCPRSKYPRRRRPRPTPPSLPRAKIQFNDFSFSWSSKSVSMMSSTDWAYFLKHTLTIPLNLTTCPHK